MAELCPLDINGSAWDGDIPEECRATCGEIWEKASMTTAPTIDNFDPDGKHVEVEYGGMLLQTAGGKKRLYSVLSVCTQDGDDVFSETYPFNCIA